jgi:hypothetical protein
MRPPYYRLTSRCRNDTCDVDTFITERKKVQYISTAGKLENTTRQVCPECKTWGHITKIEEVTEII